MSGAHLLALSTGDRILALVAGVLTLGAMFELVRRRQIREKYAALWLIVAVVVVILAIFPKLMDRIAHAIGVASAPDLLLFVASTVLLLVCVHLSWEVGRLEDKTRLLAEELAILREKVEEGSTSAG